MAVTKFETAGVDLDTLFEPIGLTTKGNDISFSLTDVDLSNYFATASLGVAYGTVNHNVAGTDLGQLFAAKGTLVQPSAFLYACIARSFSEKTLNQTRTSPKSQNACSHKRETALLPIPFPRHDSSKIRIVSSALL